MQPTRQTPNQSYGQPLGGATGDLHYRFLHFHIPLAIVCGVILFLWMSFPLFPVASYQSTAQTTQADATSSTTQHGQSQIDRGMHPTSGSSNQTPDSNGNENRFVLARFTTATGYIGLGLLGLTLLIGPANLLLQRRTPISSYLTRDVGIWAAIVSVIHVAVGFFVHYPDDPFNERIIHYFFASDGSDWTNSFYWGNWTGLVATVIVIGLLAISSDFALRKLQARCWKNLQRLNYALFVLVFAHAIFYGALLRIISKTTILLGIVVSSVFIGQIIGIWFWRRRHARKVNKLMQEVDGRRH